MSQFAKFLRIVGGFALVSSAFVFLVQGYSSLSSFDRFLAFFGLVGLNAGAGIFCIYKWQEPKSARTFLSLMTAGVSVLFAQMGAMLYSMMHPAVEGLPSVLKFEAIGAGQLGLALGLTGLCLVPATYTAFQAMMRPRAKELTAIFFALNALLLFPTRQAEIVCALLLAGIALVVTALVDSRKDQVHFATLEGKIAHLILFTPLAILFGRACFYPESMHLVATVMMALGLGIPFMARMNGTKSNAFLEISSLIFTALAWGHWTDTLSATFDFSGWVTTYVFALPLVGVTLAYEHRGLYSKPTARFAAACITILNLALALSEPFVGNYLVIFALGAGMAMWGYERKEKQVFMLGGVNVGYSILGQILLGLQLVESWTWLSLAFIGVAGIMVASIVEKDSLNVKNRYQRLMANFE